jgi:hypothetical protein
MQDTEYNLVRYNDIISALNRYEVCGLYAFCNRITYILTVEQVICFKKCIIIGAWLVSLLLKNFSTIKVLAERLSSSVALNTLISLFRILMFSRRASHHMTWFLHIKHLSGATGIRTWLIEVTLMYCVYTVYL